MSVNPWRSEKVRLSRAEAQPFVTELEARLTELNPGVEFHFGGSWRRGSPSVGDIDTVFITEDGTLAGVVLPDDVVVQRAGSRMTQGDWTAAGITMHVDFWSASPAERGGFLWYITGPKELNIAMRAAAGGLGLMLNQKGVFSSAPVAQVDDGTEADVARLLGSKWTAVLNPLDRDSWKSAVRTDTETRQVLSSSGDKSYTLERSGKRWQCSCPGFTYRGKCKHATEAAGGQK